MATSVSRTSVVEEYLARLAEELVGPRAVRRGLVQEAADHLADATEAYRRAGWERVDAERRAVADFGTVEEIAPAFQETLAVAAARRTSWLLLAVLGAQPFLWDGPVGLVASDEAPAGGGYALLDSGIEWVGGLVLVAALGLVLAAGVGNRWWRAGRGLARLTARVALVGAALVTLCGLALTLLGDGLAVGHLLLLVVFVVAPLGVTALSARHTLAAA